MPVPENDAWGLLVTEVDVDAAVVKTLRKWMPMYLAQVERERELPPGTLARPKDGSFVNTIEDDEFHDHPLPAVIVTTANTNAEPMEDGRHSFSAGWRVIVSSVVRGRTAPETRALAAIFSACVRRVLLQQPDLDSFAAGVDWISSGLQPVVDTSDSGRYLAAGINEFVVYVDSVVDGARGPTASSVVDGSEGPYSPPDPENDPDSPLNPLSAVGAVNVSIEQPSGS